MLGDFLFQRGEQIVERLGRLQRRGGLPGDLLLGVVLDPLRPLARAGFEQRLQIDRGRRPVRLGRLDRDAGAGGDFEIEAHDRLVHAADLLDVERAVAEPLAVENEQVSQHAKNNTVGDARNGRLVAGRRVGLSRAAFEKRVAVGIEQVSLAGRDMKTVVVAPFVDHPKQG